MEESANRTIFSIFKSCFISSKNSAIWVDSFFFYFDGWSVIISALEGLFSPLPVIFGVPFAFLDSIVAVQTAMISWLLSLY